MNQRKERDPNPHGDVLRASDKLTGKTHSVKADPDKLPDFLVAFSELSQRVADLVVHVAPEQFSPDNARNHLAQIASRSWSQNPEESPIFGGDIIAVADGIPTLSGEEPERHSRTAETIFVQADIPNTNGSSHVIDTEGNRPAVAFDAEKHGTFEGAVDNIMDSVAGVHGKIDSRVTGNDIPTNHVVYRTQKLGSSALKDGYSWKATT